MTCSTYLILYRHHQNASNFEQYFHVIFMVLLHSGATINAIVLVAVCGDFKAVPHHKDRFTELKPVQQIKTCFFLPGLRYICRQIYGIFQISNRHQTLMLSNINFIFKRGDLTFWGVYLLVFLGGWGWRLGGWVQLDKGIDSHSHVCMITMLEPAGGLHS